MYSEEESIGEVDENDLELIEQGDDVEDAENQANVNNVEVTEQGTENQEDNENKKVVKPKRVIKNPQPKLNEQTLQEPKGLSAVQGYFDRVKFKGRGYEEHDLNVLMKTYEYWCHRLIPKFSFDDCIARLETLGSKKATQTQIKRIRMGINVNIDENQLLSDDEDHTAGFVDTASDAANNQFDQLLSNNSKSLPASVPQLSEEQMEKIRQNKERAQRLREERLRNIKEKAQSNLEPSRRLIPQTSESSTIETDMNVTITAVTNNTTINDKQEIEFQNNIEDNREKQIENEEDNIDNILDFINADEYSSSKHKKNVLESDSENEDVREKTNTVKKGVRKCIVESDEDDESDNMNENNKATNSRKIIDSGEEDEDMQIDNILTEINTDVNSITNSVISTADGINGHDVQNKPQNTDDSIKGDILLTEKDGNGTSNTGVSQMNVSNNELVDENKDNKSVPEKNGLIVVDNSNYVDLENNLNSANIDVTQVNVFCTSESEAITSEKNEEIVNVSYNHEVETNAGTNGKNEINTENEHFNYKDSQVNQKEELQVPSCQEVALEANKSQEVVNEESDRQK